jgi:hypothetical protein
MNMRRIKTSSDGRPTTRKGIVYDTMTRGIILVLLAVLAGACTPPRPDPAAIQAQAAAAEARRASDAQQELVMTAGFLQTNAFVAPAVRADPWPCARAVVAAGGIFGLGPKPPCYAEALVRQQAATVTAVPVFVIGR